jgi:hypothetical protein
MTELLRRDDDRQHAGPMQRDFTAENAENAERKTEREKKIRFRVS